MNCKTHKTYRGIRKPTANCRKCKLIFALRSFLKRLGVPVAEARRAPKGEATKVQEFCKEFGVAIIEPAGGFTDTQKRSAQLTKAMDQVGAPTKTENFSAGLEADPEFPGVAFGAGPSIRFDAVELSVLAALRKDQQDALALQVAAVSLGAEKRVESWRTPEVAAQLQAHARGELTEHQRTALFLKLTDAGAFEQVRNIGPGAKAE